MEKLRDIRVRYNHPAIPPMGIEIGRVYTVGHLMDNYEFDDLSIKQMFIPVEGKWEDLENKDRKNKKEIKVDDIEDEVEI